jgi:N-methylhydantoinase A
VPPHAGVLSAVGLAAAPARREAMASVMRPASALDREAVAALRAGLAERAGGGGAASRQTWLRARYVGQGYELDVPVDEGDDGDAVARRFASLHERRAGFVLAREVEVVSARHAASEAGVRPAFARPRAVAAPAGAARPEGAWLVDDGTAGDRVVRGPAVVVLPDATLRVPGGWVARALDIGGWLVEAQ